MNKYFIFFIGFLVALGAASATGQKQNSNDPVYVHGDNGIEIDHKRMEARAFKNAYVRRGESTLFGDAIYVFYKESKKKLALVRAEAYGKVRAQGPDKIVEAREGQYDAQKDVILFRGDVRITKDNNHLKGKYAVMNRKTGRTVVLNHDPFAQEVPDSSGQNQQVRILVKGR